MHNPGDKLIMKSTGEVVEVLRGVNTFYMIVLNNHTRMMVPCFDLDAITWSALEVVGYKMGEVAVIKEDSEELKRGDLVTILAIADDFNTVQVKEMEGGILFVPKNAIIPYRELRDEIIKLLED